MAEVIRMPRLSDTMEEGNIIGWLKKVGESVAPGDVLAEVETDKATMELESFHEGTLLYIGVEEGLVPVDGILAIIGQKDEDYKSILEEATNSESPTGESSPEASDPESGTAAAGNGSTQERRPVPSEMQAEVAAVTTIIKASPLAKSMASQKGIELSQVQGTGDGGRIIKRDIESYLENKPSSSSVSVELPKPQLSPEVSYGRQNLSQMRKVIARRLGESKFSAPHFYLTIEINMDKSVEARKEINEVSDVRISFNDIIVKACAIALRKHPAVNSSWMEDHIMVHEAVNIGVAVAIGEGLLVPVVRNADLKSFSMINTEVKALAAKARDRKLQPEEMQGNTFTVSNLGMFDIEEFTAIINPPDACILAVGSIIDKPIIKEGEIVKGKMMKVTMSCDHRVVDGAIGAQFLQTLKSLLENPVRLLA